MRHLRPVPNSSVQIFNGRKTDQCGVVTFGSQGACLKANLTQRPKRISFSDK